MRNILTFFGVLIGIGLLINSEIANSWHSILLLLVLVIGVLYIVTGKIIPQIMESFLSLLLIPVFTILAIHFLFTFLKSFHTGSGINVETTFPILLLLLMTASTFYVIRRRIRNRRPDSHHLQGSEREPIMPTPMHETDEHDNMTNP